MTVLKLLIEMIDGWTDEETEAALGSALGSDPDQGSGALTFAVIGR